MATLKIRPQQRAQWHLAKPKKIKEKWQNSGEMFAFATAFAQCEWALRESDGGRRGQVPLCFRLSLTHGITMRTRTFVWCGPFVTWTFHHNDCSQRKHKSNSTRKMFHQWKIPVINMNGLKCHLQRANFCACKWDPVVRATHTRTQTYTFHMP